MRPLLLPGILAAAMFCVSRAEAQSPKVDELIPKATAYAHLFVERFSNVVAEERYEQEITAPRRKRVLVSDFLLVKPPGDELWNAFRDVAEVDGKPVRDREDRLMKLFLQPSSNALRRATEIREAGARHNLANIGTLNNPLLVMAFLQSQYVDRFRFNLAGLDKNLGPDVRIVRFVEFRQPTMLKMNANGGSVLARADLDRGSDRSRRQDRVATGRSAAPIRITTLFKFDEALGINVPIVMEDWYPDRAGEFRGKASYGKFRRFEVKTEETIHP